MKTRFKRCSPVVSMVASLGCSSGGTTGDFTGDVGDCDSVRFEGEGDEPALGFSMTEILAATEGRFDVPVRWKSRCDQADESPACDRASAFVETWAGTETTVHVQIASDGSKAEVRHPTDPRLPCAQRIVIPVELRLETDDGLLDEMVDATVWSSCGTDSTVELTLPLETAGGALADLPPRWSLDVTLGFFLDRMWFDLGVVPGEGGAVLVSDLPPFGENTQDLPRTSVELQAGATLPSESFCRFAF